MGFRHLGEFEKSYRELTSHNDRRTYPQKYRVLLFSSVTDKMPTSKKVFSTTFFAYYFLQAHLHQSSETKSKKNSRNQGILLLFFWLMEGSGSVPLK
jgi:hypothetical protein